MFRTSFCTMASLVCCLAFAGSSHADLGMSGVMQPPTVSHIGRASDIGSPFDTVAGPVAAPISTKLRVAIGQAALQSNYFISISGDNRIRTDPDDSHSGDIDSNGDLGLSGRGRFDGHIVVGGAIQGGGDFTSVGTPSSGAPIQNFPPSDMMELWRVSWYNQATTTAAMLVSSNIDVKNSMTITAPALVDGNINLTDGSTLTLDGSSNGIVYVTGNVTMSGQSKLNNGVVLVVMGTFTQSDNAQYQVTARTVNGYTPTVVVYNQNNATDAMDLITGSSNYEQGILYATNGNIQLTGNSSFTGSLVAAGATSAIQLSGQINFLYPTNMVSQPAMYDSSP
jgi:hypothetical protein